MEPTQNQDFQHGYSSGVEGVDRTNFEGYLSSQVNYEWLTEQTRHTREELQKVEQTLAEATENHKTTYSQLQDHLLKLSVQSARTERLNNDRKAIDDERERLQVRRDKASPDYSLLGGLLFLVAGIAFVAGDLIISHEIVAYALNIRDTNEAWAFAVGLAMVSILLKPAYDRLIEKPYQEEPEKNRSKYEKFKLALAVFSILTLAVLGWFRYEAYRTDQLKAAINKSVRQLQITGAPVDATGAVQELSPAVMSKIEKQLQESESLNLVLVNSPWALLSFVLSGILFALAGAVCLGIALPVLSAYWFRWLQADIRFWKLRRRMKRLNKELIPAEQELAAQLTRKSVLEHELVLLPSLDELKTKQKTLEAELRDLVAEARISQTDSRINSFNDGYVKGEAARGAMSEEEWQQVKAGYFSTANLASRAKSASPERAFTVNGNGTKNGLRPHQALRKFISEDLS